MNLGELAPAERAALFADGKTRAVSRGEFVYTPGDPADCVYAVDVGRVKIVRTSAAGGESIVGIRNPGDIFGELTAMDSGKIRSTSAIAIDPGSVLRVDAQTFFRRLREDATLAKTFARGVSIRLGAVERELTELAGKSVAGRLVDTLGRLAADHGVAGDDGRVRIALNLTHKDLADLIGTSRETLTKELGVLADVGLVRVEQRSIVLLAPKAFPFARKRDDAERSNAP